MPPARKIIRAEFTKDHDSYLVKYLATYCPTKDGRSGNKLFERLVANEGGDWPWSVHHSWQSWRERYVKHSDHFDKLVLAYQRKHGIKREPRTDKRKRPVEPRPIEMLEPSAKRARVERKEEEEEEEEEVEESASSEVRVATQRVKAGKSTSELRATSSPKRRREPSETPPQARNSARPTNVRQTVPTTSPPSTSATEKPDSEPEPAQTHAQDEDDSLEIVPPSPDRPEPFSTTPGSLPRHVKRAKVRLSDVFASDPPSPKIDITPESLSSEVQESPSPPGSGSNTGPAAPPAYPRAPPRIVNALQGQVLVNRQGHVPRPFPPGNKDESDQHEEDTDKVQWPPARDRTDKHKSTNGPDTEAKTHHPFSQPLLQREVPQGSGRAQLRRAIAAQFTGRPHSTPTPSVESDRRENGTSPVKRIITAAPPSDPFAGQIPKPLSKVFPVPRASTRSPFRPEPQAEETRQSPPPEPRPRPPSRTKVARHSALARVRRQTIANGNGRERERLRDVPSVDLVALSRSSMSHSGSHSSSASAPARPPRWSLPAFAHATPWIFDEPQPAYSDLWRGRTRRASLGTSTSRFMLHPSPPRPITNSVTASASHAHATDHPIQTLSRSRTPHPLDLQLAASHGLTSILAHMSENHGLGMGVVDAVYERVKSLREADEVLKGMREAAEGFGEREIKRRQRRERLGEKSWARREEKREKRHGNGNGNELRYVIASEDGEGSEYSPPETSRAAMWIRQSESASHDEETGREEEEEEAEEGREVEEELRGNDESEEEEETTEYHHPFSQPPPRQTTEQERNEVVWDERVTEDLLESAKHAHELETKLGKARYRKDVIVKHFK